MCHKHVNKSHRPYTEISFTTRFVHFCPTHFALYLSLFSSAWFNTAFLNPACVCVRVYSIISTFHAFHSVVTRRSHIQNYRILCRCCLFFFNFWFVWRIADQVRSTICANGTKQMFTVLQMEFITHMVIVCMIVPICFILYFIRSCWV